MQEGGQSYLIMPVSKACHSEMEKTERRQKSANISGLPGPHGYSSFLPVISISPLL